MKLGMPILYEYNSIKENIDLAKKLGLDFIELNLNFGYCRNEMENFQELEKLIKESNLEFTIHFYDEADFATYNEVVDAYLILLDKYLNLSKNMNIKLVNVHLNIGPIVTISGERNYIYEKEYNLYIERLINNLKKAEDIASKYNVKLVIENIEIPEYLINTYLDLNKNGFSFNYDIGHDYTSTKALEKLIEKENFKFLEFHIHDAKGKKCHLSIGDGEINIQKFKDLAKDSYVVLEVKSSEEIIASVDKFRNI